VKRLHEKQRSFLAEIFKILISIAAGALVFGQFVPGQQIDWRVVLGGSVLISLFIIFAVKLKRPDSNQ